MTYAEQLRHPKWQKRRLEMLNAADFKCQRKSCESGSDATLNVHHRLYTRNTKLWEYPDWAMEVLCETCHGKAQHVMESAHSMLARSHTLEVLMAILDGKDWLTSDVEYLLERIVVGDASQNCNLIRMIHAAVDFREETIDCERQRVDFENATKEV